MDKRIYTRQKKSLAIMVVYDAEGIVDDYIVYYLVSLREVADRIIVVVNGGINAEGMDRLETAADDVFVRPNRGFDFGAYKDTLEKYLPCGIWDDYSEIILCNDTCFGPFVPFREIFCDMDGRGLEFWSINYRDSLLLSYYESYFMVFSGRALSLLKAFMSDVVDSGAADIFTAQGYEHALSETVMQQGIMAGYYTSEYGACFDTEIYKSPDYAIRCLCLPFLKKKCFSPELMEAENCRAALALIHKGTGYPMEHIFSSVLRNYGLDMEKEVLTSIPVTVRHCFWKFYVSRDDIISFCRKHKKIYVYGKGYMSVFIMARFGRYMSEFGGYIVSDEHYGRDMEADGDVYPLSAIDMDAPIIVALLEKNSREVASLLRGRDNVVFLSIPNNTEEGGVVRNDTDGCMEVWP